jgi:hypothetical protein
VASDSSAREILGFRSFCSLSKLQVLLRLGNMAILGLMLVLMVNDNLNC